MIDGTDGHGRSYEVVHVARFEDWRPSSADYPAGCFLLIACDLPSWTVQEGLDAARRSIECGCASVSTWGTSCELLHDLFDEEDVALSLERQSSSERTLMTAWHDGVPLEEAIDFFFDHLMLSDDWGSVPNVCVALVVGAPALRDRVEQYLRSRLEAVHRT